MSIVEIASSIEEKIRSRFPLQAGALTRLAARSRQFLLSREGLALSGVVVAGAFLRLLLLGSKSFWLDEAFSVTISQRSIIDLLRMAVRADNHPPLYYLLLKLWMSFGTSEAYVRLLSVLFSIAAIPTMYALGLALYRDRRLALMSALLLAVSPFHIWYAQEARMYAMLTFLMLLSAYFFVRALQDGDPRSWVGYGLVTTLALYTNNGAIWYLGVVSLFYLISARRFSGRFLGWFISTAGVVMLYMFWVPSLLWQTARVTKDFWLPPPSFQTVLETLLEFLSFNFPLLELSLIYMALMFIWAYIVPGRDWQRRLFSLWLFLPLAFSLLVSLRQPIFISRNLIVASLGYILLIASTIWRFRSKTATLALLLPLVVMNLVSIARNTWWEQKEDWRSVARYVARSALKKPGGLVVFLPGYAEIPFHYYFREQSLPDTQGYPTDELLLHPQPRQVTDIAALVGEHPYVWLVVRDIETADPNLEVKTWLDTHGFVRQQDLVRESLTVLTYIRWDRYSKSAGDSTTDTQIFLPYLERNSILQVYTVKPGETLLEIAVRYRTTVQYLMEINDLSDPNLLDVGQELLVPPAQEDEPVTEHPYP